MNTRAPRRFFALPVRVLWAALLALPWGPACSSAEPGSIELATGGARPASTAGGSGTGGAGGSAGRGAAGTMSGGSAAGAGTGAGAAGASGQGGNGTGRTGTGAAGTGAAGGAGTGAAGGAGTGQGGAAGSGGISTTGISTGAATGGSTSTGAAGRAGAGGSAADASVDGPPDASDDGGTMGPLVLTTSHLEDVWSRHPAAFSLVTSGSRQFAAYYDASRQMTVAQRALGAGDAGAWTMKKLASTLVACDSHNYVTLALDHDGYVHVSGNMHGAPLVYFRSTRPYDVTSLSAATMVGSNESQVTYPQFFFDSNGELLFAYRDGSSGNGNLLFNRYDRASKTWSHLLTTSLIDGKSTDNSAYPVGPVRGPDGWFHLVWVWRATADAATNHDLSYAKSKDLANWQNAAGDALDLPITTTSPGIIVDPVPQNGGMINNNTKIGFDAQNRVILSYHKNDSAGTQLYNARLEDGAWSIHKTSDWTWTWSFGGQGTLVFAIQVEPVVLQSNGDLIQEWYNSHYGGWGAFALDPTTLACTAQVDAPLPYPKALDTAEVSGMVVNWAQDSGESPDPAVRYMLRWETLASNNDVCPTDSPAATPLRIYEIQR